MQNLLENVRNKCQAFVPDYAQQQAQGMQQGLQYQQYPQSAPQMMQDANGQFQQMPGMQMSNMGELRECSGYSRCDAAAVALWSAACRVWQLV